MKGWQRKAQGGRMRGKPVEGKRSRRWKQAKYQAAYGDTGMSVEVIAYVLAVGLSVREGRLLLSVLLGSDNAYG